MLIGSSPQLALSGAPSPASLHASSMSAPRWMLAPRTWLWLHRRYWAWATLAPRADMVRTAARARSGLIGSPPVHGRRPTEPSAGGGDARTAPPPAQAGGGWRAPERAS